MSKSLHQINIELTLLSPWLVHGNDPGRYGLDAVQLRGPNNERLIPGSLLLGRIRESCKELGVPFSTQCENWFGKEAQGYEPARSRVWVADVLEQKPETPNETGTIPPESTTAIRVSLDPNTLAGEDGMLQFIEQAEPIGTEIEFSGAWRVFCTEEEAQEIQKIIHLGLALHSQLGAYRNIGFGQLHGVSVSLDESNQADSTSVQSSVTVAEPAPTTPFHLTLRFDTAFSVGNRLVNGNIFESETLISGGTLKGALATLWGPVLPGWFDALHIAVAMPTRADSSRAMPIPLSWAVTPNRDCLVDTTHSGDTTDQGMALAFQPDWKPRHFADAQQQLGHGSTRRYQRVRTAIENWRAKDSKLFSYQMVFPQDQTIWSSHCKLSDTSATPANFKDLCARLDDLRQTGWGPIGKTDAFANLDWHARTESFEPATPSQEGVPETDVPVLLVSDAGLLNSTQLHQTNGTMPDLNQLYQAAWTDIAKQLSMPPPELLRYFVQHRPMGGEYLAHRYFKSRESNSYLPRILTRAGSVFVLRFNSRDDAKRAWSCLEKQAFLPLTQYVKTEHGNDWKSNPYLPENGYGEVTLVPQLVASVHSNMGATA